MLWSVVVCDLLFKLQHLVDLYGDEKAKAILAEVGKLQQANERSSEWEFVVCGNASTKGISDDPKNDIRLRLS